MITPEKKNPTGKCGNQHSQNWFLMLRKCFVDIVTKQLFSYCKIFFLSHGFFFRVSKRKYLVARKKILRQEEEVLLLYQEKIFMPSEIISVENVYPFLYPVDFSRLLYFVLYKFTGKFVRKFSQLDT